MVCDLRSPLALWTVSAKAPSVVSALACQYKHRVDGAKDCLGMEMEWVFKSLFLDRSDADAPNFIVIEKGSDKARPTVGQQTETGNEAWLRHG